ncbi:MAG: hypothetical protein GQ574_14125 [Crocinitomix sp.]|nr:hypothetical protein [Crocinitomix sp.]
MKNHLTILCLFLTLISFGQSDSILVSNGKERPIEDIRLMTPDSNFTTIAHDSIVSGEIIEICRSSFTIFGQIVGLIQLQTEFVKKPFQILLLDNQFISGLEIGKTVSLKIAPYKPDNKELNKSTGLCCIGINGYNLSFLIGVAVE